MAMFSLSDFKPLESALVAAGRSMEEIELTTWLVPEFQSADDTGNFEKTLAEQIETIVDVGYTHIGIKPSCFIDDLICDALEFIVALNVLDTTSATLCTHNGLLSTL